MKKAISAIAISGTMLSACATAVYPPDVLPEYSGNATPSTYTLTTAQEGAKSIHKKLANAYGGCKKFQLTKCLTNPAIYDDIMMLLALAGAGLFIFDGDKSVNEKKGIALAAAGTNMYRNYIKPSEKESVYMAGMKATQCFLRANKALMDTEAVYGAVAGVSEIDDLEMQISAAKEFLSFGQKEGLDIELLSQLDTAIDSAQTALTLAKDRQKQSESSGYYAHDQLMQLSSNLYDRLRAKPVDFADIRDSLVEKVKATALAEGMEQDTNDDAETAAAISKVLMTPNTNSFQAIITPKVFNFTAPPVSTNSEIAKAEGAISAFIEELKDSVIAVNKLPATEKQFEDLQTCVLL